MLNLLNFFEETQPTQDWLFYVVMGVIVVGMLAMMTLSSRKQKKRAQELMEKLSVGSQVTTYSGIVGIVVELDEQYVWVETGNEANPIVIKFLRQAVGSVLPAPGSPEALAMEQSKQNQNDIDEIK